MTSRRAIVSGFVALSGVGCQEADPWPVEDLPPVAEMAYEEGALGCSTLGSEQLTNELVNVSYHDIDLFQLETDCSESLVQTVPTWTELSVSSYSGTVFHVLDSSDDAFILEFRLSVDGGEVRVR
jgi:hypothetical protein